MSMLLSHLKSYDTRPSDNGRNVQNARAASASSGIAHLSDGKEFVKGEIIKGQVIDLRNNQATIQLTDGSVVQGKMDQDVDLYIGQNAAFEVTKSSESGIQLKIVPEQQANPNDSLVQKALQQAGLPLSDKNKQAVGTLLDANLSVDKKSIMQFLKVIHQYPQADVKALVFLQKHNLPVNEANLTMLGEYQSSEHRIISQLESLTNGITDLLSNGIDEETGMRLLQLALEVPDYVEKSQAGEKNLIDNMQAQNGISGTAGDEMQQPAVDQTKNPELHGESDQAKNMSMEQNTGMNLAESAGMDPNRAGTNADPLKHMLPEQQASQEQGQSAGIHESIGAHDILGAGEQHPMSEQPLNQHFTPVQLQKLGNELKALQLPERIIWQVKDGSISGHELLTAIYEVSENSIASGSKAGILKECMKNEILQKVYQEELFHKFTMSPKQLSNGENVKKFYGRLEQNLNELNQLLQNEAKGAESQRLTGQTEHLKNNLDFMKTLNQIYPYIQLPVRLKDQNIHSELYVFTKKKGRLSDQDTVSLLLHLDMDHIGPLDIHLQMHKKSLKAKFYVETKEVEHLFEATIDELGNALLEKGYQLYPEFCQQEKRSTPLEEMVIQEQASEGMTMKRFTFDVRA